MGWPPRSPNSNGRDAPSCPPPARPDPLTHSTADPMSTIDTQELAEAGRHLQLLRDEIGKAMVGQSDAIEQLLVALVASGHVLIEGVPGLGKTLLARALAKAV